MYYIPFNSRLTYHKTPFGAVTSGTETVFRIVLPRIIGCRGAYLCMSVSSRPEIRIPMQWECMQGEGEEWWRTEFTPMSEGVYRYYFVIALDSGEKTILNFESSLGKIGPEGCPWQLTVYSPDYRTPEWIKGSVIYQIFPDRFCASGKAKSNVPPERILREDWGGEPLWNPDKDGRISKFDFFGGDFKGIESKLGYLKSLGIGCIYLNPIFAAQTNHRYDTADYMQPDSLLGSESDFKSLCKKAAENGIAIVLDGVFSHTGADSVYFNREGRYGNGGAFNNKRSPFYKWYKFTEYPNKYDCWWGVDILPEVNEEEPSYLDFIAGKSGVLRKWLRLGASGWRLDVADELPDLFLDSLREAVKSEKEDAYILGEVWEDASNKISYGSERRYLLGKQLDSVMNYPFAAALLDFACTGVAEGFNEKIMRICENYPKCSLDALMNHVGTHDTCRVLTRLAFPQFQSAGGLERFRGEIPSDRLEAATKLLKLVSTVQFTLPGVPCVYYGDEAGLSGGEDPFNRGCYPWGQEDCALIEHYRALGKLRAEHPAYAHGEFLPVSDMLGCVAFIREGEGERLITVANRNEQAIAYNLPEGCWASLTGQECVGGKTVILPAFTAAVLCEK